MLINVGAYVVVCIDEHVDIDEDGDVDIDANEDGAVDEDEYVDADIDIDEDVKVDVDETFLLPWFTMIATRFRVHSACLVTSWNICLVAEPPVESIDEIRGLLWPRKALSPKSLARYSVHRYIESMLQQR